LDEVDIISEPETAVVEGLTAVEEQPGTAVVEEVPAVEREGKK